MSNVPCRGCERRTEGCHSDCKEYLEYVQENEEIKRRRREDNINRSAIFRASNYKI